jgi:hypothetical protein
MAEAKTTYGATTTLTCNFGGLTTGAARISDYVDNSANLGLDALLSIRVGVTTGATTGNDNAVYIYLYGSEDGTYFDDNVTGTDAAITLRDPNNLRGPYPICFATATGGPCSVGVMSVASFFGGTMPRYWGFVIENKTNGTLVATASNAAFATSSYSNITETIA